MSELMDFQQKQLELAKTIRHHSGEIAGVEQRRIHIYQELFFKNLESFCASTFPVLKSLFSESDWLVLVREFFIEHKCETPHFCEISQEFLAFLFEHKAEQLPYPFMLELAHYEWAELACSIAITEAKSTDTLNSVRAAETSDEKAFSFSKTLCVSASAMPLSYQYPVHTISDENVDDIELMPTSLIVYRDTNQEVQFMLVDQLSIVSLQLIQQQGVLSVNDLIANIQQLYDNLTTEQLQSYMGQAIPNYLKLNILNYV